MAELRYVQDFPVKGVKFIDITPKLADKNDFHNIINEMCKQVPQEVDYILSPESRGYIFGTAMAYKLNKGFVAIRKKGKLPDNLVYQSSYEKEYGQDTLCLPKNEEYKRKKFYFVDDVLATGGTLQCCKKLIQMVDGIYAGAGVYINIKSLNQEKVNYIEEK